MERQLELPFEEKLLDENPPFRYAITSYGADYPVDGLVRRINNKTILVPPFQRKFIWSILEASKFVESLILGLPVPSIFLSKDSTTNKLLIVDGQQRLLSLHSFYRGKYRKHPFKLTGVAKDLEGKTYVELRPEDKLKLDDATIHTIIVRQDEPDDGQSSIYQIFERLNSTGRPLSAQEIRACVYFGSYNEFLGGLTKVPSWRMILGRRTDVRMKEEELILRFFSLAYHLEDYEKPLKLFLNTWMNNNREFELHSQEEMRSLFVDTISFIQKSIGNRAFRLKSGIHTAVFDSVAVAVSKLIDKKVNVNPEAFRIKYDELITEDRFLALVNSGTSDSHNVIGRIKIASEKFSELL